MRRIQSETRRNTMAENDELEHQGHGAPVVPDGRTGPEGEAEEFEPPRRASAELKAILEALIFASPDPLTPKAIAKLLDSEPKDDIKAALADLKNDYERPGGLQLVEVAGGYQI